MKRTISSLSMWAILFAVPLIVTDCSSEQTRFQTLQRDSADSANLYLYRPNVGALSAYTFDINIYKYNGHFKYNDKKLLYSYELANFEYAYHRLDEGFYLIEITDHENASKLIRLEKGASYFYEVHLTAEDFLAYPKIVILPTTPEFAVVHLIEEDHMFRHEQSED